MEILWSLQTGLNPLSLSLPRNRRTGPMDPVIMVFSNRLTAQKTGSFTMQIPVPALHAAMTEVREYRSLPGILTELQISVSRLKSTWPSQNLQANENHDECTFNRYSLFVADDELR